MDKISVIIPCYNGANTIERCLNSILAQTHTDFEIIFVDDGSTDETAAIINTYCEKDERIKYIYKPNGGVGSSRNAGLKIASGEYIQFIDADDDIHPKMFERMLSAIKRSGADIAVCRFNHDCFKAFLPAGIYDFKKPGDALKFYSDFFTFNVPWNKLFKREIITESFDETLKIFEDGLFVLNNLKNAGKIIVMRDRLYNYYNAKGAGSLVNNFLKSKFWENKEGYWYKFNAIKPYFDNVLKNIFQDWRPFEYARSFDMAFWELIKLIDSGCDKEICALEIQNILNEPNFICGVKSKGYEYHGSKIEETEKFVARCFEENAATKIKSERDKLYLKFIKCFLRTYIKSAATAALEQQQDAYSADAERLSAVAVN